MKNSNAILLGLFVLFVISVGAFMYWGTSQPTPDVTPVPAYEVQTVPARIQEQEAASSTELDLSTSTEEKATNAPLIDVR